MEPVLRAEHVTVCYDGKAVVNDVSFVLHPGEILGIVGESGSGKSTIIKVITGLLGVGGMVTGGDIFYKGQNMVDMNSKERRCFLGPEIGMVFQDCKASFSPIRTIGNQIYESLSEHEKVSKAEAFQRAEILMKKMGLTDPERVWDSYPFELSGGMNQRAGICAAMLMKPSLLLADEPTSALDVTVQKQVVEELKLLRDTYGTSIILVTHNIGVVRAIADKILVLNDGKVMDYGTAEKVLYQPENTYTRTLMDSVFYLRRNENGGNHPAGRASEKRVCKK